MPVKTSGLSISVAKQVYCITLTGMSPLGLGVDHSEIQSRPSLVHAAKVVE